MLINTFIYIPIYGHDVSNASVPDIWILRPVHIQRRQSVDPHQDIHADVGTDLAVGCLSPVWINPSRASDLPAGIAVSVTSNRGQHGLGEE